MEAVSMSEIAIPACMMLVAMAATTAQKDKVVIVSPVAIATPTMAVAAVGASDPTVEPKAISIPAVEEEEAPKSRKAVRVLKKMVAPWRKWDTIH
jgi:hypothetical protein